MAYLNDAVFDNGLNYIVTNTEKLYLLSADSGLTWANIASYALGSKTSPVIGSPADRSGGGRQITISAITDGSITVTGTATHFALTDNSDTKILAAGVLSIPLSVTNGGTFATAAFIIAIPDPV